MNPKKVSAGQPRAYTSTLMKKIPKVITKYHLWLAYQEGMTAFTEGAMRGWNPYKENNQELASAWWEGWDAVQKENQGNNAPSKDEPDA